jgi:hypothetical protein
MRTADASAPGGAAPFAIAPADAAGERLDRVRADMERPILEGLAARNGGWFDVEMDKRDRWAEDRRQTLKAELSDLDDRLKELKKAARFAPNLPEKLSASVTSNGWRRGAVATAPARTSTGGRTRCLMRSAGEC